jgi:nascent polypeptide-associated complex subunit alpha
MLGVGIMLGGMNPHQMKKMMKQMGISQEEISAEEVIIRGNGKEIVITNPQVVKIKMGGNDSFQITGQVSEREGGSEPVKFSDEDVEIVVAQTGCTAGEARQALEDEGDIAKAILKLKG